MPQDSPLQNVKTVDFMSRVFYHDEIISRDVSAILTGRQMTTGPGGPTVGPACPHALYPPSSPWPRVLRHFMPSDLLLLYNP